MPTGGKMALEFFFNCSARISGWWSADIGSFLRDGLRQPGSEQTPVAPSSIQRSGYRRDQDVNFVELNTRSDAGACFVRLSLGGPVPSWNQAYSPTGTLNILYIYIIYTLSDPEPEQQESKYLKLQGWNRWNLRSPKYLKLQAGMSVPQAMGLERLESKYHKQATGWVSQARICVSQSKIWVSRKLSS